LNTALNKARADKKIVLLDFYADWCETCIRINKDVFDKENVKVALSNLILLRADVTINDNFSHALLKRFHVVAPPTLLLFNQDGKEQLENRLIGGFSATELITEIKKISQDFSKE
ncbi:MAG: thioredoxin family protein, partial [Gammaproteobacteria bacterium]|nr:thioredoxin family protein [Gammaproteobacteria bacterium]